MEQKKGTMADQTKKRIVIYLALAFGISWLTGLVIFLTGGLQNSPTLNIANTPISLALILLATTYMFGPSVANLLTRLITKEGCKDLYLKPHFGNGRWKYYLAAWFLPGLLTILGMVAFFLIFPGYYDASLTMIREQLASAPEMSEINPWLIIIVQTLQALLLTPLLNAIPTFGEEFGWRGYLQPKLMPLGAKRAVLLTGVIWGIWHWPIILMGHNYGTDYFGAPFLGPIAMVWFTLALSIIFGWVTIKSTSVWPAVIGHGAINGIANLSFLFVQGNPDPLLGPTPVGVIGGLGLSLAALWLLLSPNTLNSTKGQK